MLERPLSTGVAIDHERLLTAGWNGQELPFLRGSFVAAENYSHERQSHISILRHQQTGPLRGSERGSLSDNTGANSWRTDQSRRRMQSARLLRASCTRMAYRYCLLLMAPIGGSSLSPTAHCERATYSDEVVAVAGRDPPDMKASSIIGCRVNLVV